MDLGLLEHRAGPSRIAAERSGRLSGARQQAKGDESGCDKGLHCQFPIAFFKCAQRPSLSDVKLGMGDAKAKSLSRRCDRTCESRELGGIACNGYWRKPLASVTKTAGGTIVHLLLLELLGDVAHEPHDTEDVALCVADDRRLRR